MLPYKTWSNREGEWFFEIFDSTHQQWVNHGPFEDSEQAEYAAMRYLQHE